MIYNLEEKAIIFIDGFLNLEYKHKRGIIDSYSSISDLFTNPEIAVSYLNENNLSKYVNSFLLAIKEDFVGKILSKYEERGLIVITEVSDNYPNELINLPINPICLYVKGNVELLNAKRKFSIVGSRKSIPQYLKLAKEFSESLSSVGIVIVTGVAVGGDLSAIEGAINNGNLILTLAGGHDFIKSEINRDYILKTIENGGLVISEYPPEVPTLAYHYPVRNRIIAGLSQGVLIVSGENKSGTRHTASFALDYGKEIFTFPYTLGTYGGELPNSLIKDGAYLVTCLDDIAEVLGYNLDKQSKILLTNDEEKILKVIKDGKTLVDDIVSFTNLKIFEVIPLLTSLEIKGVVVKSSGNEYTLAK